MPVKMSSSTFTLTNNGNHVGPMIQLPISTSLNSILNSYDVATKKNETLLTNTVHASFGHSFASGRFMAHDYDYSC